MSKPGFAPSLPLIVDYEYGPYRLHNKLEETIKQNLKMLLLTSPGERVMIPIYGVGLRDYLFSPNTDLTRDEIKSEIMNQISTFMPFLQEVNIDISESETSLDAILLKVSYYIGPIGKKDYMELILQSNLE
tara:strand:+ start:169 stop:561 length:393 start_codon:yes stop_codon:yes gene_type:complete